LAVDQLRAGPLYSYERLRNLTVDCVIDHILKLILSLDLLIKDPKSDILEERQNVGFVIHHHAFIYNVNQESLPIFFFCLWYSPLITSLIDHLVM
jgi:hypothetical protein